MINEMIPRLISKNPDKLWFRIFIIVGIFFLIVIAYNRININKYHEGFEQNERFIGKHENEIYDDFYVELYDKIHQPELQTQFIIEKVINMTMPSKEKSVFLDVGSGTGHLTNELHTNSGYQVYGIDKSQSMVNYSKEKYPELKIIQGDIMIPMTYDRNLFSHILCLNMTIYHLKDKVAFFRNCYFWLKPNGYIILHLADRSKFDPIVQAGKPTGIYSAQKYAANRITDTEIDFIDFKYKSSYDFGKNVNLSKNNSQVIMRETMIDSISSNIRQNEMTLYMEDYNHILHLAQQNGFIVHGQVNMLDCIGDEHQYIFVLERTL